MTNIYYAINKDHDIIWVEENYWNTYHCINNDEDDVIVSDIANSLDGLYDGHYICHPYDHFGGEYRFSLLVSEQELIDAMKTEGYNFIPNPDLKSQDSGYIFTGGISFM